MNRRGKRWPEIGKFRTARWVEAPYSASTGTSISPIESRSMRVSPALDVVMAPIVHRGRVGVRTGGGGGVAGSRRPGRGPRTRRCRCSSTPARVRRRGRGTGAGRGASSARPRPRRRWSGCVPTGSYSPNRAIGIPPGHRERRQRPVRRLDDEVVVEPVVRERRQPLVLLGGHARWGEGGAMRRHPRLHLVRPADRPQAVARRERAIGDRRAVVDAALELRQPAFGRSEAQPLERPKGRRVRLGRPPGQLAGRLGDGRRQERLEERAVAWRDRRSRSPSGRRPRGPSSTPPADRRPPRGAGAPSSSAGADDAYHHSRSPGCDAANGAPSCQARVSTDSARRRSARSCAGRDVITSPRIARRRRSPPVIAVGRSARLRTGAGDRRGRDPRA